MVFKFLFCDTVGSLPKLSCRSRSRSWVARLGSGSGWHSTWCSKYINTCGCTCKLPRWGLVKNISKLILPFGVLLMRVHDFAWQVFYHLKMNSSQIVAQFFLDLLIGHGSSCHGHPMTNRLIISSKIKKEKGQGIQMRSRPSKTAFV